MLKDLSARDDLTEKEKDLALDTSLKASSAKATKGS